MMASNTGKRRGWRVALGALALGTAIAGVGAAPALAHDGDNGWHRGWDHRDRDRDDWRRREWREQAWREHERREHSGWFGYSYYAPPPVVYAPPPAYGYYPSSSLNVYIPLR